MTAISFVNAGIVYLVLNLVIAWLQVNLYFNTNIEAIAKKKKKYFGFLFCGGAINVLLSIILLLYKYYEKFFNANTIYQTLYLIHQFMIYESLTIFGGLCFEKPFVKYKKAVKAKQVGFKNMFIHNFNSLSNK